jgi:acyl dehydratase
VSVSFPDILLNQTITSSRITITDAHIVTFAGLTGDFNPLHMDAEFAASTEYGQRIAHGMLGHALSTGLRSIIDDWAILAFLETRRRFVSPIFVGDTLHYKAEVGEKRASRTKPDRGVVRVAMALMNQRGELVQEGEDIFLVGTSTEQEA